MTPQDDADKKAREVVQKLNHCNDESFEHPKHKAGLEWQIDTIAQALRDAHIEAIEECATLAKDCLQHVRKNSGFHIKQAYFTGELLKSLIKKILELKDGGK